MYGYFKGNKCGEPPESHDDITLGDCRKKTLNMSKVNKELRHRLLC